MTFTATNNIHTSSHYRWYKLIDESAPVSNFRSVIFHSWLCSLRAKYSLQLQHFPLRLYFPLFNRSQQTIIELLAEKRFNDKR